MQVDQTGNSGVFNLTRQDFFDSFDGNFANAIFYSRVRKFELTTFDTLLSVKVALSGPEEYVVDGRLRTIPQGHFGIINTRNKIETTVDSEHPVEGISIFLDNETVQEVCTSYRNGSNIEPVVPERTDLPWFDETVRPLHSEPAGQLLLSVLNRGLHNLIIEDFVGDFIEKLNFSQGNYWQQVSRLDAIKPSTRIEIHRRLEIGRQIMWELDEPGASIDRIARRSCMSKYNFIRYFRLVYQETPYQFLLRRKIERAKVLLARDPDRTIGDIADELGFADHSTFGKRFKSLTGQSPNAYRKAHCEH